LRRGGGGKKGGIYLNTTHGIVAVHEKGERGEEGHANKVEVFFFSFIIGVGKKKRKKSMRFFLIGPLKLGSPKRRRRKKKGRACPELVLSLFQ